jgi:putative transposase
VNRPASTGGVGSPHVANYQTRAEARASIFEYIETFYNPKRRHSSLGYVSPAQYEQDR